MPENESAYRPTTPYDATIVIVTKDRKQELRTAVQSALRQEGRIEVLVIDDGSTDGTAEMMQAEFPSVRLDRVEQSQGYIAHRNRSAELATAPIVFSIDDDAVYSSPLCVRQTLADFNQPRVGAVAIPSIDVNQPGQPSYHRCPPDDAIWVVESFRGTAYAVRRDLFLKLAGYQTLFFHQGEEGEFCLRLLNAGYVTRLGTANPIHHLESPKRDRGRMFLYDARNRILFAWYNVPLPHLLYHLPATMWRAIVEGARQGYARATLRGVLFGFGMIFKQLGQRRPVTRQVYRLSRRLRKQGPLQFEAIESSLPEPIDC